MAWSEFRRTGLTCRDSRCAGGYTLITPIGGNSTYLLDAEGRIVHGWTAPAFQPGYGYLLPGRSLDAISSHARSFDPAGIVGG